MPKYTFECRNCSNSVKKLTPVSVRIIDCEKCGQDMLRAMPKLNGQAEVSETVNKYTNTQWKDGQKEEIQARKDKYYWTVEVPRMVNSGTYGLDTMLEMGWVYLNEKEEICINDKPPSER